MRAFQCFMYEFWDLQTRELQDMLTDEKVKEKLMGGWCVLLPEATRICHVRRCDPHPCISVCSVPCSGSAMSGSAAAVCISRSSCPMSHEQTVALKLMGSWCVLLPEAMCICHVRRYVHWLASHQVAGLDACHGDSEELHYMANGTCTL